MKYDFYERMYNKKEDLLNTNQMLIKAEII